MSKVLGVALIVMFACCANPPPLVIVASVDGPSAWPPGYLVGDATSWRVFPHSDRIGDLIAAVHEGFRSPWAYGPPGGLRGQGALLTLAGREGWTTAVFASPVDSLMPLMKHLAACAEAAWLYPSGSADWSRLLDDLAVWAVSNRAPRFAVVHLSLHDLAPGNAGATTLTGFWSRMDAMIKRAGPGSALIAVYLPHPERADSDAARLRVLGAVPGASLVRDTRLSTLDVAPTVATVLELLYTPDYPGQSLAALETGGRVEPVPMKKQGTSLVMGNRWIATACEFQNSTVPSNVRFFDLWRGQFSAHGSRDPAALALLDSLPYRAKPFAQDSKDTIP